LTALLKRVAVLAGLLFGVLPASTAVAMPAGGAARSAAALTPAQVRVGSAPRRPGRSKVVGALAGSTRLPITVTLKPRDPAGLASYAAEVSTPGSPLYHRYLTVAQFRNRFGPTPQDIGAVESSLSTQGLRPGRVSANGLAIGVTATAGELGRAFSTGFQKVALASGRTAFANTRAPQFSASVADSVQGVIGLNSLTVPHPQGIRVQHRDAARTAGAIKPNVVTGGPQPCSNATTAGTTYSSYTADQIASAYKFSSLYGAGDEGSGQTIALFELEPNLTSDIAKYQSCYGTTASVTYVKVDGGAGPGAGGGEAALDIEDVIGLAPQAAVRVYQGPNTNTGAYDTYNSILSQDKATVISTSWGMCETGEASIIQSESTLFEEAATQGQSVFASAGDYGSEDCGGGDNSLAVDDPASQPDVTGVGGTSLSKLGPPPSQSVWNNASGATGGGVSAIWPMPSYQSEVPSSLHVINSKSSGTPCGAPSGDYCREVPDVSADADPDTGYVIYYSGQWGGIGGTSASAPLWAAFMALVNASSGCNGTPIGFANPVLYAVAANAYSSDFSDVISGNNDFTGTNGGSFPAGKGYDMATGLGTPIGSTLPAALCAGVIVVSPGNRTNTLGTAATLRIDAADSTSGATLTYAATGLPPGLSIDSTSGLISGTPTTFGTYTVKVTVTDASSTSGSTTFMWTVAKRSTNTSLTCSPQLLGAGRTTSCTAEVSDNDRGTAIVPTGTVTFAKDGSGSFSSSSCALSKSGSTGRCTVTYTPSATGPQTLTATYGGDSKHGASPQASFPLSVPAPPTAQIASPGPNQTYAQGKTVPTTFSCTEGSAGPGLAACSDTNGTSGTDGAIHGTLDTAGTGTQTYTVTATSQDGLTRAVSLKYTVLARPTSTAPATIAGAAKAGDVLACSPGSWTEDPAAFSYQWSRDGTPIVGATSPSYRLQTIDEGNVLTCTVTATNVAGTGSPATSAGFAVPVRSVARCPAATGKLTGTKLGLIALGMTRKQTRRAYKHSSTRGSHYQEFFCLTPIGIRAGFASPKALSHVARAQRKRLLGHVVWISTASAFYAIDGVRTGATITAAGTELKLGAPFAIGSNRWYLAPAGPATAVLKVRGGIVQEIGIANRQLTKSRTAQRTFLSSFS
jgi:Pro-kumamolisin, activation domain/Putative Ig domain/Bacterial Ig-like domain (group 3)